MKYFLLTTSLTLLIFSFKANASRGSTYCLPHDPGACDNAPQKCRRAYGATGNYVCHSD